MSVVDVLLVAAATAVVVVICSTDSLLYIFLVQYHLWQVMKN